MLIKSGLLVVALAMLGRVEAADRALIKPGDSWSYFKGMVAPPVNWTAVLFDDSSWPMGPSGFSIGFGNYDEATTLPDMPGNYGSVFLRRKFVVAQLDEVVWPVLRIDYDDGFVAYLNGVEIARRGLPGNVGEAVLFNTPASPHPRGGTEEIDLRVFRSLFSEGTNVLALQVHNAEVANATWAVVPELLSGITRGPFLQSTSTNRTLVVWKTAIPVNTKVEFGLTPQLGTVVFEAAPTTNHVVELTGLLADTTYFYQASSAAAGETVRSHVHSFTTLKSEGAVKFLVVGDTGIGQSAQYDIARELAKRGGDLLLHLGDIVYPQFTSERVDAKLFGVYGDLMAAQPWFFTIGNHDLYAGETHYLNAFHLPTNAVTGTEHYYSFDHGDVHFSVLLIPYVTQYQLTVGSDQYRWLTNDLATTSKPWKVLAYHVPMQTSALHRVDDWNLNGIRDSEEIREVLLPVAAQYGVQVTFSGHDHVFERFAPTNGVHTVTTGGGGVVLYGLAERDAGSVQLWPQHHFVEVEVAGDRMEIRAIDRYGNQFDSQVIHRLPPMDDLHTAAWHSPVVESAPPNDGDGNLNGQGFDLIGAPIATKPGAFAGLGEVYVNNDKARLYVGVDRALLRDDSVVYLFIESPRLRGVTALAGLGNGLVDPASEGADGLDLLENLSFANFAPALGIILGDETADTTWRYFQRPANGLNTGQGAFVLNAAFADAAGVHVQQFNRSPQSSPVAIEQNADLVEVSIPYATLGGLQPGHIVRIGAVVAGNGNDAATQRQRLDTAFLGTAMTGSGTNLVVLSGVRVRLAPDPDRDGDGLPNDWEVANNFDPDSAVGTDGATGDIDSDGAANLHEYWARTNPRDPLSVFEMWLTPLSGSQLAIRWRTEAGLRYQLEAANNGSTLFGPIGGSYFPRTGTEAVDSFTTEIGAGSLLFRLKRVE